MKLVKKLPKQFPQVPPRASLTTDRTRDGLNTGPGGHRQLQVQWVGVRRLTTVEEVTNDKDLTKEQSGDQVL